MNLRYILLVGIVGTAGVAVGQTVTLSLSSPQNGTTVAPNATINWSIDYSVSTADNAGLALLTVDLTQAPANPAKLDIPAADAVPAAMANFSRPAGICNPGETNLTTGYIGVQRGTAGEKNLRQIGGALNTFGQARPPGSGIAENATVTSGIGQSGSITLASGSFAAPATPGVYYYQLENPIANLLTMVNPLPQHSPVVSATVNLAAASIGFNVISPPCNACDVNCDGRNDGRDIGGFVTALQPSPPAGCSPCAGDTNNSGGISDADITTFVACLLGA